MGKISKWQGELFSVFILIAGIQVVCEIFWRYVLNSPTTWGLEVTIYLCGMTYIMGGAYAEYHDVNIRIDFFFSRWKRRTQLIIRIFIIHILFFIFVGFFTVGSYDLFWEALTKNEGSGTVWDPKIWPLRLLMSLGSTTLLLLGLSKFLVDLSEARKEFGLAGESGKKSKHSVW
jgi:TRAP-type mannitol/chloroaromatic compound transport system permease small subunit